jgi:hypothetical protein
MKLWIDRAELQKTQIFDVENVKIEVNGCAWGRHTKMTELIKN